jgi:hypothetical protein
MHKGMNLLVGKFIIVVLLWLTHTIFTANVSENFNRIKKSPMQTSMLQWYNMYGAPEFKQEKLLANVAKG